MKDLISLFYSNLKRLNTRIFILFEHTDYIFIQLVLVKELFQTRNCFIESDLKRNGLSDILQQPQPTLYNLARTTNSPQIIVFSTETKEI